MQTNTKIEKKLLGNCISYFALLGRSLMVRCQVSDVSLHCICSRSVEQTILCVVTYPTQSYVSVM